MTWEDTIIKIRKDDNYKTLVEQAYFDEDLKLNIERFSKSDEFLETLNIIKQHAPLAKSILDVGSGNGISAINFALNSYKVTVIEPDHSATVGAGAIKILKKNYALENIDIYEDYAEDISFDENSFDVVYVRQAMHHANNLNKFVKECVRVLKPKGVLLTIRDHVIYDETDKEWFLRTHPLHKFYGGENAFKSADYKNAITKAGAEILKEYKYYDNVINFFPKTVCDLEKTKRTETQKHKKLLEKKIGIIMKTPLVWYLYKIIKGYDPLNEKEIPGRMYSYLAVKK